MSALALWFQLHIAILRFNKKDVCVNIPTSWTVISSEASDEKLI
jgi:hypothetical protein